MTPKSGHRVKVGRDEKLYPSRGTWSRYRGQVGTVCRMNEPDEEYGVMFTADASPTTGGIVAWFKSYELTVINEVQFQAEFQGLRTAPVLPQERRKR